MSALLVMIINDNPNMFDATEKLMSKLQQEENRVEIIRSPQDVPSASELGKISATPFDSLMSPMTNKQLSSAIESLADQANEANPGAAGVLFTLAASLYDGSIVELAVICREHTNKILKRIGLNHALNPGPVPRA